MSGPSNVSSGSENSCYSSVIQHLYNTIETYTQEELHSKGIAAIWCEVQEIADSCSIFIADFSNGESLLMKKQISTLTVNQDYRPEIDTAIHKRTAEKVESVKAFIFERFDSFTKRLEKESCSDEAQSLSYKLEPLKSASEEDEIFQLVGTLRWKGKNYSITFEDPIDCKVESSKAALQRAIDRVEEWSSDISLDNIESKLKEEADGLKVSLETPKREPQRSERPRVNISMPLSELIPLMRGENFAPDSIFSKNFEAAWSALEAIVRAKNPYKHISAEELLGSLKYEFQPAISPKTGMPLDCCQVTYNGMYWDLLGLNELNLPVSKEELLRSLEEIVYFSPAFYNMLRKWATRNVFCTTKFQNRENGRAFVVGIHQLGETVLYDPSNFDLIQEGPEKIVIPIPNDIYTIVPWQFCNDLLEPIIISLFERLLDEDVQTMVKDIGYFSTTEITEKLNAKVWWALRDRKTIKMVIDLPNEKSLSEVFQQVISNLLQKDKRLLWERELKRETYNSISAWGLDPDSVPKAAVRPMVMTLKKSADFKPQFKGVMETFGELQVKYSSIIAISYILYTRAHSPDELHITIEPHNKQPNQDDYHLLSKVLSQAAESVEGGIFEYEIEKMECGFRAKMLFHEFSSNLGSSLEKDFFEIL